jgi:cob(I)alamin adenosyltransferase
MKIYTKTGDQGETGLFSGERVRKSHPRVTAYGTLDEMNSHLGAALAAGPAEGVREALLEIQCLTFEAGADLATASGTSAVPRIQPSDVSRLEVEIDRMESKLVPLKTFILPGGTPAAAQIHVARAVSRRAEREAVTAADLEPIPAITLEFLNRLSDYLFVLARYENHLNGVVDTPWTARKTCAETPAASR